MAKGMARKLTDAAELVSALSITRDEMVGCTVDAFSDLTIQLRPVGFARVFQALGITRKKLDATFSEEGHLHAKFIARGAEWCCVVLRKEIEGSSQWTEILEREGSTSTGCIESNCRPIGLPSPT